jgi:hypothetical protein
MRAASPVVHGIATRLTSACSPNHALHVASAFSSLVPLLEYRENLLGETLSDTVSLTKIKNHGLKPICARAINLEICTTKTLGPTIRHPEIFHRQLRRTIEEVG